MGLEHRLETIQFPRNLTKKKKILRLHSTRSKIVECHYFHFIDSGQNHNKNGLWKHSEVHKEIQLEVLEKVRMCAQDQHSFGY